jgi:hypothetical protein
MDQSIASLLDRLDKVSDQFLELREGVHKAVDIASSDPDMALTRARKVLEYIIRDVFERHIKEPPGTRPLENLLQRLVKDGYFPDRLDAYANTVRKLGNVGVHSFADKVTAADVYQSLTQLIPILEWYFETEWPNALGTPPAPKKAPVTTSQSARAAGTASWMKRRRYLLLSVAALFGTFLLAVGLYWLFTRAPGQAAGGVDPSTPLGLSGKANEAPAYHDGVDILVWRTAESEPRKLRLTDAGALPLVPGDQIRITARIQPAAYLYLFWIDEEGSAAPVYPWKPGKWGTRPANEKPVTALDLPEQLTKGFTITAGREGMETLILLARDTPLALDDDDLKRRLRGLPPQRPLQSARAAIWFEDGKVVENDQQRKRADFEISDINDPVLRLQERLRIDLQPLARYSAAVSFARQGGK